MGGLGSSSLSHLVLGLLSIDTTSPLSLDFVNLVVVVCLDGRHEGSEIVLVFGLDIGQSDSGGSLLVNKSSETRLGLDDAIGDTHLAAEGGQPEDEFNRINIVGDDDQLGLLGFYESGDVVDTVLDHDGLLSLIDLGTTGSLLGEGTQTSLLISIRFRAVLVKQLEELGSGVLVQGLGELVDRGRDLQTLLQDGSLTLQTNVRGPLDETGKITLGLNSLTCID